jgi:hypothetical protein
MTDLSSAAQNDDRMYQTCEKCGKGTYQETSIHDDWDGVLHCTNKKCNHEVKRYKWKDNPPPKPEKVKLSPVAQAVLDAAINVAKSPDAEAIAAAALYAVADQVVPEEANAVGDEHDNARYDQWMRIRYKLLAIATELKGQP